MHKRRYEVLLPAMYNDGRSIMHVCVQCFPQTLMQVTDQFGALSYKPYPLKGVWTQAGQRFDDELFRLTVDVEDTPESQQFMAHFKQALLTRFEQLEIYVVAYGVEVL